MFNEPGRLGIQKHAISCPIASLELFLLTIYIMYLAYPLEPKLPLEGCKPSVTRGTPRMKSNF